MSLILLVGKLGGKGHAVCLFAVDHDVDADDGGQHDEVDGPEQQQMGGLLEAKVVVDVDEVEQVHHEDGADEDEEALEGHSPREMADGLVVHDILY